jgi:hypothetical protein
VEVLGKYEDDMICDLAEFYHIYDYEKLPIKMLATLVSGLREDSRVKCRLAGLPISLNLFFMSAIYDKLAWLCWTKTEGASKGRGMPESITAKLLNTKQEKQYETFASGEDFRKRWKEITDG